MKENEFYVYIHIDKSTDTPFYIGFGQKRRVCDKGKRSKEWCDIVDNNGYYYGILKDQLSREEANIFEKDCIKLFLGIGFKLVNKINGGSGNSKRKPYTEEYKKVLSDRGKKYWKSISIEDKEIFSKKMSTILKGKKKPKRSEKHCSNLSDSLKGKPTWNKGIKCEYSDDVKDRMCEKSKKPVIVFDISGDKIGEFESLTDVSKYMNVSLSTVSRIFNKINKKSKFKIFLKEIEGYE